jgi:CDP-glucose 4,6-dehydratase
MKKFNNIYKNKTVLVTGHTGFKGSWLSIWLHELGANVVGYALNPHTDKDNFVVSKLSEKIIDVRGDIRDREKLQAVFEKYQPEFVFHLAAQPLVRYSYEEPVETYDVNVMGSIYVMEAFKKCKSARYAVMITTDKCYENKEQIWGYKETDPLGGYDPYSSSKGACEIAIQSYRNSFFNPLTYNNHGKAIASARAGNVIGGGDWAQDRIVPDLIRAFESKIALEIRNPSATRPWQHVLEPVSGYLLLGQKLAEDSVRYATSWNFGPEFELNKTVWEIVSNINEVLKDLIIRDVSGNTQEKHEAKLLYLDITKAKTQLGWVPTLSLEKTINMTIDWYKKYNQYDGYELCLAQIKEFNE